MANSPPVAPFTSEVLGETRVWGRQVVLVAAVVAVSSIAGVPAAQANVCNNGAVKPGSGSGDWYECRAVRGSTIRLAA
jgi:hypothetical protein